MNKWHETFINTACNFLWYPEYNTGSIILCNKEVNSFKICEDILKDFIKLNNLVKNSAITQEFDVLNGKYFNRPEKISCFTREFLPGVFFINGGEVIDFNSAPPTYKNINWKKITRYAIKNYGAYNQVYIEPPPRGLGRGGSI